MKNRFGKKCGTLLKSLTLLPAMMALPAIAATETLFGNDAFSVFPTETEGDLWILSENGSVDGMTLLSLKVNSRGTAQVVQSKQEILSTEKSAVHGVLFSDERAEHRRIPVEGAGKLGLVYPMYGENDNNSFLNPEGFFSIRALDSRSIYESPLEVSSSAAELDSSMDYAISGFAYDADNKVLWAARGALGITGYDISKGPNDPKETHFVLNRKEKSLEKLSANNSVDLKKFTEIYDLKIHPETGEHWLATAKGLWIRGTDGTLRSASALLDSMRVTGVWMGGKPLQIIAETSKHVKESLKGNLWRKYEVSKEFSKVAFLDMDGKAVKKDVYDNSDYTVSNIAFVGDRAFVLVSSIASLISGILKLDSNGVEAYKKNDGDIAWLYDSDMGVTDRKDIFLTSLTTFPMKGNVMGLAVSTYGNGISVSADTGKTWTPILNRAKLDDNLGTIRMVPSVIVAGDKSLVSYKVSKESNITIEVFSYDMKLVRKIVKSAPRSADAVRSTKAKEDVWDGKDDYGRPCTMGVYYVRVKDNHGHVGWGKVMTLGGGK